MKTILQRVNFAGRSQIRYQILSFLYTLLISITAFPQGENWRIISEQPTPRHGIGSCEVDGKIFCIGGTSNEYNPEERTFFKMVTVFDPVTGVWDTCQSMPGQRAYLFSCAINGKIYAIGGRRSNSTENLKVVEIYDIEKDEWSTGTSMPKGAAGAAGCLLDDRIYIIGGLQQSGWMATDQLLRYNPVEDNWENLDEMDTARAFFSANVINGKIYAIGGANNPDIAYRIVEEYDPAKNDWVKKTAMPSKRGFHAGVVINDRIWVMSGTENFQTVKTTVEIYDPAKDTWSSAVKADYPSVGSWAPTLEATNSKVYLYAGFAPGDRDVPEVIEFDYPVIRLLCDTLLTTEETLKARFYEEGNLYLVPEGTPAELDSITKYSVGSWQGMTDQELSIPLDTFPTGAYLAYGVASDGRIDGAVSPLHVITPTFVEIPDTIFLNALFDLGVDINEDNRISLTEARPIQSMDISQKGISDLTGIEAFVNLGTLDCGGNPLITLNLSRNLKLRDLSISEMPTLCKVCFWFTPFPEQIVDLNDSGSPNVFFTSLCYDLEAPTIWAEDSLYQPDQVEVTSSEDGIIYLVHEETDKNLCNIREVCIDSVAAIANDAATFTDSMEVLQNNGVYWLYARDESFNVSEPMVFEILGVGVDQNSTPMVRIYPNPFGDLVTIETDQAGSYVVEIANVNGQMVHYGSFFGSSNQIDLSILQKGIYFVAIISKDFNIIRKVVKR